MKQQLSKPEHRITCPEELDPTRTWSPRTRQIVAAARDLVERDGWDGLSMRALGDRVGMRAPSLYKHVAGRDALRTALIGVVLAESGALLHSVVADGGGIAGLLDAYRRQAHRVPNLYRLATSGTLPRSELPAGLEEWSGAPFFLVCDGDPYRAQALWSLAHGMVILELDRRYPTGRAPDETWQAAAAMFTGKGAVPQKQ